jgi:DNA-binding Lrp family transcriptional regulator
VGAYILINTHPGVERQVIDELSDIPGVVHVEGVYGGFDIIVRVELSTDSAMIRTLAKIRRIDGIRTTLTMSFIQGQQKKKLGIDPDHFGPPSN